ncbi:MAG: protein kinase [Nannocystaceae bacterium]|nr:protein kinase [Nannocystaceae bacterium]
MGDSSSDFDDPGNGGSPTEGASFDSLLRKVAGAPEVALDRLAPEVLAGDVLDGKLRIESVLGRGGMGVVYLAHHIQLGRQVAVKLTSRGANPRAMARLLREAQAMASITHDNVVTVYDVGTLGEQVYIAMEYVDGGTASSWLSEEPRSWRTVVDLYLKAGRGLAAAHGVGLVHRDFKPDNVLVGRDGRVRVADFGLVRLASLDGDASEELSLTVPDQKTSPQRPQDSAPGVGTRLTATGALAGTPAYMAPEQFDGVAVDDRSDQFSFCVSLFEALFDSRPYATSGTGQFSDNLFCRKILEPTVNRRVPVRVRRALARGLSRKPRDRFAGMDKLLEALEHATTRRRRAVLGTATLVLLGGASMWASTRSAVQTCEDSATLRDVWNDRSRERLRREVLDSDLLNRDEIWRSAQEQLDGFVSGWEAIYLEACATGPVKREVALSCLAAGRVTLRSMLVPDPMSGPRAAGIVATGIPATESCRPLPDLVAASPADNAVKTNTQKQWSAALRLYRVDEGDEALKILEQMNFEHPAVRGSPTHGHVLAMTGDIRYARREHDRAISLWREAIPILIAVDDVNIAIQTTVSLAVILHELGSHNDEEKMLTALARAWLERATNRDWLAGKVALLHARVLMDNGKPVEAEQVLREAIASVDEDNAPGPAYDLRRDLGSLFLEHDRPKDAREVIEPLFETLRQTLPPGFRRTVVVQVILAEVALKLGDLERCEQLVGSLELPPTDTLMASASVTHASLLGSQGDPKGAMEQLRVVLALAETELPRVRAELALREARAGELKSARASLSLAIASANASSLWRAKAEALLTAAETAVLLGDLDRAEECLKRALPTIVRQDPSHKDASYARRVRLSIDHARARAEPSTPSG